MRDTAHQEMTDLKDFMALPERRSLGQSVYENLKEAIIEGSLVP